MVTDTAHVFEIVIKADNLQAELDTLTTELIRDPTSSRLGAFREQLKTRFISLMTSLEPKLPAEAKEIEAINAAAAK
jgi:hypothetical protein